MYYQCTIVIKSLVSDTANIIKEKQSASQSSSVSRPVQSYKSSGVELMGLVHTYVGSSVRTVDSTRLCFSQRLIHAALKSRGTVVYCGKCVLVNRKDRKEGAYTVRGRKHCSVF